MASQAESQSNIIPFPSQGAPRAVNKPQRRRRRKDMVFAWVDANLVIDLCNRIYLLNTVSPIPAGLRPFAKVMLRHIEQIREGVDVAVSQARDL